MMARRVFLLMFALVLALVTSAGARDPLSGYEKVRKLAIGGEGGWDFLEVDPATRGLFVTRGTHVVVLDLESEKVIGEISDTPGVHGIAFVADLNRGFTSNGGDSSVTAFDTKTLKTLGKVKADGRPDIIYFRAGQPQGLHLQPRQQQYHGDRPR
jgi:DNA-binding beta-propeller fold protein YncE